MEKMKTILLVEDEVIIAMSERLTLEKFGYSVIIASTGEQALHLVDTVSGIDLILMDINLGKGIDGTAAAEAILNKHDIPLIFLSSHTESGIVEKTEGITSYGYIVKNSGETVLLASIKMAFRLFEAKLNEQIKDTLLIESEYFFKESQRAAQIGSYKTDFISGFWKSSEVLDAIFGIGKDYTRSVPGWLGIIHPDERERMNNYLNEEVIKKKRPFNMEYRIVRVNDQVERWVHGLGEVAFDNDGNIISMIGTIQDITDRKKNEIVTHRNRNLLKHILDSIPQAVFWKDTKSVYLGCNLQFAKITVSNSTEEVVGKTDYDLPWQKSDADAYRADDHHVITNKTPKWHIIEQVQTVDGARIWVDTTKLPLYSYQGDIEGVLGVFEDITRRKQTQEALIENEERYRKLFMYSPYGILIANTQSYYLDANPSICRMLGYAREELIGLHASDIVSQTELPFIEPALSTIRSDANYNREWQFRRKDGSVFVAEVNATTMPDGNLMGIISDISERRQAEKEIAKLLQEKTILLKEVHHRMKNNISLVEGLLTLQSQSISNPEMLALFQDSISRVKTIRVLYDNLLIEDNYTDISSKKYFERLIDTIVSIYPNMKNILIEKSISDFAINSKTLTSLGIIVNELITNAVKYAFRDTEQGTLRITIAKTGNRASIIIADNGIGMSPEIIADGKKGFGYLIIDGLVKQLGGTLTIKSEKGTTCRVECEI